MRRAFGCVRSRLETWGSVVLPVPELPIIAHARVSMKAGIHAMNG